MFHLHGLHLRQNGLPLRPPPVSTALLPMLALRFASHVPYFKFGSGLFLPHGMSLTGAVVTALAYSLLCLGVARWLTGRRAVAELFHRPVAAALIGTLAIASAMLVLGPFITLLLPADPAPLAALPTAAGDAARWRDLLPPYVGLLLPVCAGFFAAQTLARARARQLAAPRLSS